MTTLCEKNRAAGSTKKMFHVSLIIPLFVGLLAWALASGAAPTLKIRDNYLAVLGIAIAGSAMLAFPISYFFQWNWEAKYFGTSLFPFSSGALLSIYPILCIAKYGSLPIVGNFLIIGISIFANAWWCYGIVKIYKRISESTSLMESIYFEKSEATYYLQREDRKIVERNFRFDFYPPAKFIVAPLLTALVMVPFSSSVTRVVGVPFTHTFMAIGAFPLSLIFLGMCTKCWLVYYHYPRKIKKKTGKRVYVDISSTLKNYRKKET